MGQGGFGGQYETGVSSKRSPDERSDIQGWTPHIAEPVITVRAQLRSSRGAHSRDPLDPLRKRFAFVAGNDGLDRNCRLNSKYQAAILASAASNAAAALAKSVKARPLSAVCFCASVAVGRISAIGFPPSSKADGAIT
jgi:hypothetical protein